MAGEEEGSKGSGRVDVEVLSVISSHGGESLVFNKRRDDAGDFDTSIDAQSGSNK